MGLAIREYKRFSESDAFATRAGALRYLKVFKPSKQKAVELLIQFGYYSDLDQILVESGYTNSRYKPVKTTKTQRENVGKYIDLLHEKNDSYVAIAHVDYALSESGWHEYHYERKDLADKIIELMSKRTSTYMSINEFYMPRRNYLSLRYLTSFYVDIDAHDDIEFNRKATMKFIDSKIEKGALPPYTAYIISGRGVQIYWKIELAPATVLYLWQTVQEAIIDELSDIKDHIAGHKVDTACSDPTRVLRVPETYNPKAKKNAKLGQLNADNVYRMADVLHQYFPHLVKVKKRNNQTANVENGEVKTTDGKTIVLNARTEFRAKILRQRRCHDLKLLLEQRKNKLSEGQREQFLFIYGWTVIERSQPENWFYYSLSSVNSMFSDPLKDNEVRRIAKIIYRKFDKRVLKQTAKKDSLSRALGRYTFRNKTIIDRLEITPQERADFETIFWDKEEKERAYVRRKNKKRREARRDEHGFTKREFNVLNQYDTYMPYLKAGWGYKRISKELNLNQNTVKYHIQQMKKKGLI